ncbi:RcnB family protein [Sphingomonas sp.]|uniref:RcnB family protein n=1 Tax=Sphingomonas sp. TaxID=28214 RepID=UPI002B982CC8|nr:RcnB family protein [Sphingomonas sp.]HWK35614.1 RcnB family protein [Sphingomonas sp.]
MKKMILAAVAASLVSVPAMAAPFDQRHPPKVMVKKQANKRVVVQRNQRHAPAVQYRNWSKGQRFDSRYARNYSQINNWQQYRGRHLYAPPRGYHWVRSGNDAVLVAIAGGLIGAVVAGAFN